MPNLLEQRELRPVGGEVRLKKVLALRSAIAAGRYDVPSELVAEAILRYKRGQDRTDAPLYSA